MKVSTILTLGIAASLGGLTQAAPNPHSGNVTLSIDKPLPKNITGPFPIPFFQFQPCQMLCSRQEARPAEAFPQAMKNWAVSCYKDHLEKCKEPNKHASVYVGCGVESFVNCLHTIPS